MMSHIRITCKWPPQQVPHRNRYPIINSRLPDLTDCAFYLIDKNGSHILPMVDKCTIYIDKDEVVRASLDVCGVELDIEAMSQCSSSNIPSKL